MKNLFRTIALVSILISGFVNANNSEKRNKEIGKARIDFEMNKRNINHKDIAKAMIEFYR